MTGTERDATDADRAASGAAALRLGRIPLIARAVIYYVTFLGFILIAVPWAADYLGSRVLPWRLDTGWLRWLGWALFASCWLVYTYASIVLMRRGRGAYVEFDPPSAFVATGPFRWCRNPIAACVVGMILGEALAFSSVGILLLFVVAVPLAHLQVVCIEEPRLRERFGQTYSDYLEHVPRWIPRRPRGDGK